MRTVICIVNDQLQPAPVHDRRISNSVPAAEKADRGNPRHTATPFAGVVTMAVSVDVQVSVGQAIASIGVMKMEAPITVPKGAVVVRVEIGRAHV